MIHLITFNTLKMRLFGLLYHLRQRSNAYIKFYNPKPLKTIKLFLNNTLPTHIFFVTYPFDTDTSCCDLKEDYKTGYTIDIASIKHE